MKLSTSTVAMFLLVGSSLVLAAGGPGGSQAANPQAGDSPLQQQNVFGRPSISGDGIQNATQVDDPSDIGSDNATTDSPEPAPTVGGVGVQNAK